MIHNLSLCYISSLANISPKVGLGFSIRCCAKPERSFCPTLYHGLDQELTNCSLLSKFSPAAVLCGLRAVYGLWIFNSLEKIRRIMFHDVYSSIKLKFLVSVNKFLLKHSHAYSLMNCLWLFLHCNSSVVETDLCLTQRKKIFDTCLLTHKFAEPWIRNCVL